MCGGHQQVLQVSPARVPGPYDTSGRYARTEAGLVPYSLFVYFGFVYCSYTYKCNDANYCYQHTIISIDAGNLLMIILAKRKSRLSDSIFIDRVLYSLHPCQFLVEYRSPDTAYYLVVIG